MKRYELAKRKGLSWQVVLISDAETDLKVIIRDCVIRALSLSEVNRKVNKVIEDTVKELDSENLKNKVRNSFPSFASRLYYKWLNVYGTRVLGIAFLAALNAMKVPTTSSVKEVIKRLPEVRELGAGAYNRATPNAIYNLEYERQVKQRMIEIADMSAKENYASKYSLRASSELQIRAEWHEKQLDNMRKSGVKLCWIDSHANCSERCAEWQGRLYSLDGTTGSIDGIKYEPIENAMNVYDKYGYKNGCLSGFNCRHKTIPYKKGFKPVPIPEKVMARQRQIEKEQRYMERTVRRYEARALVEKGVDKEMYKHYKGLANKWQERYKSYSRENKVPFYPARLDI